MKNFAPQASLQMDNSDTPVKGYKGWVYYLLGLGAESSELNLAALHIKETLEDPSPP